MQSQENKLIELTDVWMQYEHRCALKNVNLTINKGDYVAITGPNGGGKTTLLKIMLKLIKPTHGSVSYWMNGQETDSIKIGYLPQKNMIDSKFPISVKETIVSGLFDRQNRFSIFSNPSSSKVDEIMEEMGIAHLKDEALGNLSGGQMQRTLLGRALISEPKVLILDEPLSYVDKRFEQQIYKIISQIAPSTTIVLVSHEMTGIAPIATRHIIVDQTIHDCHAEHHYIISECE